MQLLIVDGERQRVPAFCQPALYIEQVRRHEALLHLPQVAPVDGKPAAPHHSLEHHLQRATRHLTRHIHLALISGHSYE